MELQAGSVLQQAFNRWSVVRADCGAVPTIFNSAIAGDLGAWPEYGATETNSAAIEGPRAKTSWRKRTGQGAHCRVRKWIYLDDAAPGGSRTHQMRQGSH